LLLVICNIELALTTSNVAVIIHKMPSYFPNFYRTLLTDEKKLPKKNLKTHKNV